MSKPFLFVLICLTLAGCRAKRLVDTERSLTRIDDSRLELRRLDSLWSSSNETQTLRIEYYPESFLLTDGEALYTEGRKETSRNPQPGIVVNGSIPESRHDVPSSPYPVVGRGQQVKSVEYRKESSHDITSVAKEKSDAANMTEEASTEQVEKSSEARQDNGTVIGVAIVAAVAWLCYRMMKEVMS